MIGRVGLTDNYATARGTGLASVLTMAAGVVAALGNRIPTWGASVAVGQGFNNIVATDNTAYTVVPPTIAGAGSTVLLRISNTSGGAMGAATFTAGAGGWRLTGGAWTNPATANSRSILFVSDGTNWIEAWRSAADVPN